MNTNQVAGMIAAFLWGAIGVLAQDQPPALSFSKAAKLAEDAITSGTFPADCFLRTITLIQKPDSAACYRVTFKPSPRGVPEFTPGTSTPMVDVIYITMDGKVSFSQESGIPTRRRTMLRDSDASQPVRMPEPSPSPEKHRAELNVGLNALGDFEYDPAEKAFHFSYQNERYWFHIGRIDPAAKPETGLLLLQQIRSCKALRIQALAEPVNGSVVVTGIVCVY